MTIKTTIRKNIHGEYVVRLWVGGVHQKDADYFASDRKDAEDTAAAMVKAREGKGNSFEVIIKDSRDKAATTMAAFDTLLDAADALVVWLHNHPHHLPFITKTEIVKA